MLRAEQAALEQHGKAELLRILDREFEYYKQAYDSVGTQAALMAGFTVTVIVTLETSQLSDTLPDWIKSMYHLCGFTALMALIYTVMAVTTIVVWGPGLALRGSDPNSMHRAVDGIKAARFEIFISFFFGVVAFLLMSVCVAWVQMDKEVAGSCTALAVGTLICILINGVRTKVVFNVPVESNVGTLTYERVSAASSVASADSQAGLQSAGWGTDNGGGGPAVAQSSGPLSARHSASSFSFRRSTNMPATAAGAGAGAASSGAAGTLSSSLKAPLLPPQQPQQHQVDALSVAMRGATETNTNGGKGKASSSLPSSWSSKMSSTAAAAAATATTTGRESLNRASDELATKLIVEGGGWLWKKDKRTVGVGWKKRWVSVHQDTLFYSKGQQPPRHHHHPANASAASAASTAGGGSSASGGGGGGLGGVFGVSSTSNEEEKRIGLGGMDLSVGSDGRTLRLTNNNTTAENLKRSLGADSVASSSHSTGGGPGSSSVSLTASSPKEQQQPAVVDFRCDVADERGAWVAYLKAGIATGMKLGH